MTFHEAREPIQVPHRLGGGSRHAARPVLGETRRRDRQTAVDGPIRELAHEQAPGLTSAGSVGRLS